MIKYLLLCFVLTLLLVSCTAEQQIKPDNEKNANNESNLVEESQMNSPGQDVVKNELGADVWLPANCEIDEPFRCDKYSISDEKIKLIIESRNKVHINRIYGDNCEDYVLNLDVEAGQNIESEMVCSDLVGINRKPLFIEFYYEGAQDFMKFTDIVVRWD